MTTWNAADPPELAPATSAGRVIGALRLAGLIATTVLALAVFLPGKALRSLLGRWVVFHFGAARFWSRICLRLSGLSLTVTGTPIRAGALVANHSSWIDILALRSVRLIYFVSKDDVAAWPGVGYIARVTGTIFIKRKRAEAKRQEEMLRDRIGHDALLGFFPEGTSTDSLRVLGFKSSLFSVFYADGVGTDIRIQPVTIRYQPAAHLPANFYGWWGTMSFEGHIWDVVTRSFGGRVHVIFHDPVRATDFPDRKSLAGHCQGVVATPFGQTEEMASDD